MTYPPGNPGYPSAQSPGPYESSSSSFAKSGDDAGSMQGYLTTAVVALGLVSYLASFGPMFTVSADAGPIAELPGDGGIGVALALLAALLAGASLLPKAKNYAAIIAVISVLGALRVIAETLSKPSDFSIGWALWLVLACTGLEAVVAVAALLLDAGVIVPPQPRPKYEQYGEYGYYGAQQGGYYGQHHGPYQQQGPPQSARRSSFGPQFGGYPSSPAMGSSAGQSTGGLDAVGPQSGRQQQTSESGQQQGTPTPPTGFPSFSPPPSAGSGSEGSGQRDSDDHGGSGQSQQSQPTQSYGQQSQPTQSYSQGRQPPSGPSGS
jgi:hypothetical protein